MEQPRFRSNRLIDPGASGLLVVDVQQKLLAAIARRRQVVFNVDRLVRGADLLGVPAWATVQYAKGLGPLEASLAERFPNPEDKLDFSAAICGGVAEGLEQRELSQVVVVGIESHVCILQTALDLLARHYDVFVVCDAVAARSELDHNTALNRINAEGASVVSTESVLFEWCQTAANDQFKAISEIVRETMNEESENA